MMLALLVVLSLTTSGAFAKCCTMEEASQVQRTWNSIWSAEFTGRRIALAQSVFAHLFANNPAAKGLFARVNADNPDSNEFRAHCVRVANGLDTAISLLTDSAVLNEQLAHLGNQHAVRQGVTAAHFGAIARSFAHVIPQVSHCFNPEAWEDCFDRIASGIVDKL